MKIKFLFITFLFISMLTSLAFAFEINEKVEVLWQGSWYKAQILNSEKNNFYKVHFTGYWNSRNENVLKDRIRPIVEKHYPELASLKSGDTVEFMEKDHWREATVVEKDENKLLLRYADGKGMKEKWISYLKTWKKN